MRCGVAGYPETAPLLSVISGLTGPILAALTFPMPELTGPSGRADAYLICATPRTGSSLLCGLLDSTGVAGHPESYFRRPDEQSWAEHWGIASAGGGRFRYADYLHAALDAGRTGNGVFAARIMWGTMTELTGQLGVVYPDLAGTGIRLLRRAFGATRFIYLYRDDVLAQAVSRLRAEQTSVWFQAVTAEQPRPAREPRFDRDQIRRLVHLIGAHNVAWREWFESAGAEPYPVRYEDLAADPAGVAGAALGFLGLELPAGREILVRHRRLADELNVD